jgi:hypothetical protein
MATEITHLGSEAKIRLPNVDEVLDKGHALHASDDRSLEGTEAQSLARQIISEFKALRPESVTEEAYLSAARSIVLGYGRALSRRKEHWKAALLAAQNERQQSLDQMRESTHQNAWLSLLWKLMTPAILVMTGIVITQTSDHLPENTTKTLTWLISLIVGGVFALIGRLVGAWLRDLRRNTIEVKCSAQLFQAHIIYEEGKAKEQRYFRARMCEAWEQYTGEMFPRTASYEMVMAGDIETRKEIERQRLNHNASVLWLMRRFARMLRGKRKGEREDKQPEIPSPVSDF